LICKDFLMGRSEVADLPSDRYAASGGLAGPRRSGWTIAAGGLAAVAIASLAVWLRSRSTQPEIDAQAAERLAPRRKAGEHPRPSAADIIVGS
jgi:hypothetical protein